MVINVHAGHNPDGKIGCGAVGILKESTEARKIKEKVISLLKDGGHTVYDCTVDDGRNQSDVLDKIVKKCNAHTVDLDVSIHLNSGRNDRKGDNSTGGVEVLVYSKSSKAHEAAKKVCEEVAKTGLRNRGVKYRTDLYVLKKTKSPAMLIECCFVDDADDAKVYNVDKIAKAIVNGILNKNGAKKEEKKAEPTKTELKIKIVGSKLDIYKEPNEKSKKTGCIKDHKTYTIVQTVESWGKLKSGAGWIPISSKHVKSV